MKSFKKNIEKSLRSCIGERWAVGNRDVWGWREEGGVVSHSGWVAESHVVTMPFITSRWLRELVLQLSCQQQETPAQCPLPLQRMTHFCATLRTWRRFSIAVSYPLSPNPAGLFRGGSIDLTHKLTCSRTGVCVSLDGYPMAPFECLSFFGKNQKESGRTMQN